MHSDNAYIAKALSAFLLFNCLRPVVCVCLIFIDVVELLLFEFPKDGVWGQKQCQTLCVNVSEFEFIPMLGDKLFSLGGRGCRLVAQ